MKLLAGICGGFPRPKELDDALDALEAGKISRETFVEIAERFLREVIRLQENSGMDVLTSGLLTWRDPLEPFAAGLSGIELGGLSRFFDTSLYYRRPIIAGKITWNKPIVLKEVQELEKHTSRLIKAVVPGPYTFLKLSENLFYESADLLVDDLIEALKSEINMLGKVADFIQVDEPSLVDSELSRIDRLRGIDIVNELLTKVNIPEEKLIIATYFDLDIEKYSLLLDLRAGLHLDLTSKPYSAKEALSEYGYEGKLLSLGVIDSRSVYPVDPREIVYRISKLLDKISADTLIFSTSSWLNYIPYHEAVRKLDALGRVLAEAEVRFG